jgi:hypothetical protein
LEKNWAQRWMEAHGQFTDIMQNPILPVHLSSPVIESDATKGHVHLSSPVKGYCGGNAPMPDVVEIGSVAWEMLSMQEQMKTLQQRVDGAPNSANPFAAMSAPFARIGEDAPRNNRHRPMTADVDAPVAPAAPAAPAHVLTRAHADGSTAPDHAAGRRSKIFKDAPRALQKKIRALTSYRQANSISHFVASTDSPQPNPVDTVIVDLAPVLAVPEMRTESGHKSGGRVKCTGSEMQSGMPTGTASAHSSTTPAISMPLSPIMRNSAGSTDGGTDTVHDMSSHAVDLSISSKLLHANLSALDVIGRANVPYTRRGKGHAANGIRTANAPGVATTTAPSSTTESPIEVAMREAKVRAAAIGALLMPDRRHRDGERELRGSLDAPPGRSSAAWGAEPRSGARGRTDTLSMTKNWHHELPMASPPRDPLSTHTERFFHATSTQPADSRRANSPMLEMRTHLYSAAHSSPSTWGLEPPRLMSPTQVVQEDMDMDMDMIVDRVGSGAGRGDSSTEARGSTTTSSGTRLRVWKPSGGGIKPSTPDFISKRDFGHGSGGSGGGGSGRKAARNGRLGPADLDPMRRSRADAENVARARVLYSRSTRASSSNSANARGSSEEDGTGDRSGAPLLPAPIPAVQAALPPPPPNPSDRRDASDDSSSTGETKLAWGSGAFGDAEYRNAIAHAAHSLEASLKGATCVHQSLHEPILAGSGDRNNEAAPIARRSVGAAGMIDLSPSFLSAPSLSVSEAVARGERLRRQNEEAVDQRAKITGALDFVPQGGSNHEEGNGHIAAKGKRVGAYHDPTADNMPVRRAQFDAAASVGSTASQEGQRQRRRQYALAADIHNIHRHCSAHGSAQGPSATTATDSVTQAMATGGLGGSADGRSGCAHTLGHDRSRDTRNNRSRSNIDKTPRYAISSHIYPGHHGLCTHNFPGSPQAKAAHVHSWR